jgi:hypothetical protein
VSYAVWLCIVLSVVSCRGSENHDPVQQGFNSDFVHTLGSTLEDGFFGGVKWGLAAAFYHMFYRMMATAVSGVPHLVQALRAWYAYVTDSYAGRPPALNIHELQVLVTLLKESLQEYEALGMPSQDKEQQKCVLLCGKTLAAVMRHIDEYITVRTVRYTNLYTDQELLFVMQLIVDTIEGILECVECGEFHKEIVATAKTTIVLMNKLIALLQGPVVDKDAYDPSMAWFSGQRGFYVRPL